MHETPNEIAQRLERLSEEVASVKQELATCAADTVSGNGTGQAETPHETAILTVPTAERPLSICPHCGKPIDPDDDSEEYADEIYHLECLNTFTFICDDCGERRNNDDRVDVDGKDICCDCIQDHYDTCYDCGCYVHTDETYRRGGRVFCESCESEWTTCSDCGYLMRVAEATITHNGEYICQDCYDEHYFTCNECGRVFYEDYRNIGINDNYVCDCCYEENRCNHGVMDYHGFGRNHYGIRRANGETATPRELAYGVELECDRGHFDMYAFEEWMDDDDLIHFEHDGSLSSKGVECITQPCTLRFHQHEMRWRELLDNLVRQGFRSHETTTCGLHVHISRNALNPTTIVKMDVFINRAHGFFRQIARRDNFYGSSYERDKRAKKEKARVQDGHDGRYTAVNTTNERTVEVRIFRGSLKEETVIGTIELLDALVHFLEYVPIMEIYETERNVLRFIDYCGTHSACYPHLMPMMARLVDEGVGVSNILHWMAKGKSFIVNKMGEQ